MLTHTSMVSDSSHVVAPLRLSSAIRTRRLYRVTMFALAVVLSVALVGCGSNEQTPSGEEAAETEQTEEPQSTAAVSSSQGKFVSREIVPEGWLAPLASNEDFFRLPEQTQAVAQQTHAVTETETVRLLGFAEVGSADSSTESTKKAILKIGDALVYAAPGERHSGIEVLSIESRSVNLQHGRDRWTLSLMSQPLVNKSSEFKLAPGANQRLRKRQGSSQRSYNAPESGFEDPALSIPDLPDLPLPPELPELPEVPDLPDFGSFPDLPDLPGLP